MTGRRAAKPPTPGERLVSQIVAEMQEAGVAPDAKESALLTTARQLVDRLDALEQVLERDGLLLTSSTGVVRVHPAVAEHRQLAATLPKVLVAIVVGDSSAGRNPVKQRAAQVRWNRRDRLREAQDARVAAAAGAVAG